MSTKLTRAMLDLHFRHWRRRWSAKRLDCYLGGRGIGVENLEAAKYICAKLKPSSILELGPGSWRFARVCLDLGVKRFVGIETTIGMKRSLELMPTSDKIAGFYTDSLSTLHWNDKEFDVVYQCNTIPNLVASQVEPCLSEVARITRGYFVWAGDLRCRFWDFAKVTMRQRRQWMQTKLDDFFETVERLKHGIVIMRPR